MASVGNRPMRPPPLQTIDSRPATAPSPSTPTATGPASPIARLASKSPPSTAIERPTYQPEPDEPKPTHQHFVLADFVAFQYLEEDAMTTVVERRAELKGYQCYVVEQWATSRSHPTFTITTYTGEKSQSVYVGVLSVPTDESTWSDRLRVYFKALNQYKAKRSETPLGILMVTSLASFHSSLTLIPVPDGDLMKHRGDFFVNENLKRLGCSGRVGLNLAPPAGATVAKFQQLYHTSDKNDIYKSVIGLVKLCQIALTLFNKLEEVYADGLLCDVTERAVNDWWREIGTVFYHVEPHDGILGPTTVAGLLGLLMGARNRLHSVNCPVSKDAFDAKAMKRGIGTFQKQQRLTRSYRLDRRTLERLHQVTERNAEHGGWAVPKAVKSTVAELSGKGGEMVMDAVGRRDRAGIAEIETVEIERFTQLLTGERAKWLWYGKPLKNSIDIGGSLGYDDRGDVIPRENEQNGFGRHARKPTVDEQQITERPSFDDPRSAGPDENNDKDDDARFKSMAKRGTGLKEARAGVSRLKDAVRLGGHHEQRSSQKSSKEEQSPSSPKSPVAEGSEKRRRPMLMRAQTSPSHPSQSPRSMIGDERPGSGSTADGDALSRFKFPSNIDELSAPPYATEWQYGMAETDRTRPPLYAATERLPREDQDLRQIRTNQTFTTMSDTSTAVRPSIAESVYRNVDLDEALPTGPETEEGVGHLLRRTLSFSQCQAAKFQTRSNDAYPRHLSFSLAEESVLTWSPIVDQPSGNASALLQTFGSSAQQMANEEFFAQEAKYLRSLLGTITTDIAPWTDSQLAELNTLLERADALQGEFDKLYQPRADGVQAIHASSEAVMRDQTERLMEERKETETLAAKLEYEIDGLRGRIDDVGAGVRDFRNGVQRVEERVRELEKDQERSERGWGCGVM